jgi:hypothetical protein
MAQEKHQERSERELLKDGRSGRNTGRNRKT